MRYTAVLVVILLSLLACQIGPTPTLTPWPTPVHITVEETLWAYEYDPAEAKNQLDGNPVMITGIQHSVEKARDNHLLILESGLTDIYDTIQCEVVNDLPLASLPTTWNGDAIQAHGIISGSSAGSLILKDCVYSTTITVPSIVMNDQGMQPSSRDLSEACAILDNVGFSKVANDSNLTRAEASLIDNQTRHVSDIVVSAMFAIVSIYGKDTKYWCIGRANLGIGMGR